MTLPPLRDVRDVIAFITYDFGYPPADSLVLLPVGAPQAPVVRLDVAGVRLAAEGGDLPGRSLGVIPAGSEDASAAWLAWSEVVHLYASVGVEEVVVVGFGPPSGEPGTAPAIAGAVAAGEAAAWATLRLADVGIGSRRSLVVHDGSWADVDPCPRDGGGEELPTASVGTWTPIGDLAASPVVAAMVGRGVALVADRSALLPDLGEIGRASCPGCARASRRTWLRRWQEAVAARCADPTAATPDHLACLPGALSDRVLRDAVAVSAGGADAHPMLSAGSIGGRQGVLDELMARPLDASHLAAAESLLEELLRRGPRHDPVDGLALLAWLAWASGRGARAQVIATEALRRQPSHRLASITAALVDEMVPPPWRAGATGVARSRTRSRDVRPRLHSRRIVS